MTFTDKRISRNCDMGTFHDIANEYLQKYYNRTSSDGCIMTYHYFKTWSYRCRSAGYDKQIDVAIHYVSQTITLVES